MSWLASARSAVAAGGTSQSSQLGGKTIDDLGIVRRHVTTPNIGADSVVRATDPTLHRSKRTGHQSCDVLMRVAIDVCQLEAVRLLFDRAPDIAASLLRTEAKRWTGYPVWFGVAGAVLLRLPDSVGAKRSRRRRSIAR